MTDEQQTSLQAEDVAEPLRTRRVSLPVVLIGPINAGKSSIAELMANRLGVGRASLDVLCWDYFDEAGYEAEVAREYFERGGQMGALEYMVHFYPGAVERVLAEYPQCVIDLGAGHTVYDDPDQLERVRQMLAGYPNVVLLLPSSDPDESIRILSTRQSNPHPEVLAMNDQFIRNPSNALLATIVAYTKGKTPEQTCEEIIDRLR